MNINQLQKNWSVIAGVISLIGLAVLVMSGPDITNSEYVPRYEDEVNYNQLLNEFGSGTGVEFIMMIVLAGVLSVSIFSALRSGDSMTRSGGLLVAFVALVGGAAMCVSAVTSLNFTGNSTTLTHLDRLRFDEKVYTLALMDTEVSEPRMHQRSEAILFECTTVDETSCRPLHTQFLGVDFENRPRISLAFEESGEAIFLRVDDEVVYQVGDTDLPALPADLQTLTADTIESLTEIMMFEGLGYALDWSGGRLVVGGVSGVWVHTFDDDQTLTRILQTPTSGAMEQVVLNDDLFGIVVPFDEESDTSTVQVVNSDDGSTVETVTYPYGVPLAVSADLSVVAGGRAEDVTVREMETTAPLLRVPTSEERPAYAVALSPDGSLMAIAGEDTINQRGYMQLWEVATESEVFAVDMLGTFNPLGVLVFSPDGQYVVYSRQNDLQDTELVIWDTQTQAEVRSFSVLGRRGFVRDVVFNAESTLFAAGSQDGILRVWSMTSGEQIAEITAHAEGINSVTFDDSGRLIATASDDGTVKVWGSR